MAIDFDGPLAVTSRKKPKTLSGIETKVQSIEDDFLLAGKNLKPYQGLKQVKTTAVIFGQIRRRKKPKTLSGIETFD